MNDIENMDEMSRVGSGDDGEVTAEDQAVVKEPATEEEKPKNGPGTGRRGPDKKKRKNPHAGKNGYASYEPKLNPGDNSKLIKVLMDFQRWGIPDVKNVDALYERFDKVLQYCYENDVRITNKLVYYGLGVSHDMIQEWASGISRTPDHMRFAKKVREFCAGYREMLGANGKINPVVLVWWQKNYDGFTDRQEVVVSRADPLGAALPEAELAKRIEATVVEPMLLDSATDDSTTLTNDSTTLAGDSTTVDD